MEGRKKSVAAVGQRERTEEEREALSGGKAYDVFSI